MRISVIFESLEEWIEYTDWLRANKHGHKLHGVDNVDVAKHEIARAKAFEVKASKRDKQKEERRKRRAKFLEQKKLRDEIRTTILTELERRADKKEYLVNIVSNNKLDGVKAYYQVKRMEKEGKLKLIKQEGNIMCELVG